jgi:hypothetical protein
MTEPRWKQRGASYREPTPRWHGPGDDRSVPRPFHPPPPPRPDVGGLYLVATPIESGDMTLRALDVLAAADLVLAEDYAGVGQTAERLGSRRNSNAATTTPRRSRRDRDQRVRAGEVVTGARRGHADGVGPRFSDRGPRTMIAASLPVHPIPASSLLAAPDAGGATGGSRSAVRGVPARQVDATCVDDRAEISTADAGLLRKRPAPAPPRLRHGRC